MPQTVDARRRGWRLAAVADGLDSMLYLGLLDREPRAASSCVVLERELAA